MKKIAFVIAAFSLLFCVTLFHTNSVSAHSSRFNQASSFCHDWSCEGYNPSPNCLPGDKLVWYNDIYDDYTGANLGRVEMWWSPSCEAVWANVYTLNNRNAFLEVDIDGNCGSTCSDQGFFTNNATQNAHSNMIAHFSGNCYSAAGAIQNLNKSSNDLAHAYFQHCF